MPSKKTKGSRKTARKAVQSAAKVSNRTDAQNDEESKAAEEDSFLEEAIKLAAKEKKALKKSRENDGRAAGVGRSNDGQAKDKTRGQRYQFEIERIQACQSV
mmetsp:Transcript_770/g.1759  ORF Transcript_770/g.1759 Transcript_770/m.1759 type:complete len:102 (-) Transcript_770:1386-1691(-)